ncbi:MAG: hypothetical protein HC936_02450 [Leptolyngbyaceae cyanobacterium SU_3_3]|nr:hypothetical protein [Leptolyngbyaceae cyanobacterium SU_3_3]
MATFAKFRVSRILLLISLAIASCFLVLLFIVGEPAKAAIPGWSWSLRYLNGGGGDDSIGICVNNLMTVFTYQSDIGRGSPYGGTTVYNVVGDNMIINVCVERAGNPPAIVTFVTGGNGTAETQPLVDEVNRAIDVFDN